MAVKDKFVLEISAQLKKDGNQLVDDLKTAIGEIEKNTKLDLGVDEEKVNKYLEKLKASLSEINSAMNNAGLEANSTTFRNFVDVLKEGANYSKEIATSLQKASGIIGKIDDFNNSINAAKNKAKLTKNEKDLTIGELQNKRNLKSTREEQLKTLKSTYKEYSKYDISKSLKGNIEKNINELGQDLSNLNIDISNTDEVNNEIERIKKNVTELVGELDKVEIESYKKDNLNNLKKELKLKTEIQKLYSSMANDVGKKTNGSEVIQARQNQISSLYKELEEVKKEREDIIKNFKQINSVYKLDTIDDLKGTKEYNDFKKYENKANVDLAKRNSKLDERYSKYSGFEEDEKLYTKNENSSYNKYVNEYKKILGEYQAKINEFKSTDNKVTNFNIDELVEYENKLKELLRLLNSKDFKDPTVRLLDDGTSFKEARSEIQKLIDDEGKLIKKSLETKYISPNITEITACYKEQDGQIRKVAFSYNELTGAITKTNKASQDVATTSKFDTFGDKLKKKFGDLGAYLASFASFYEVVNVIKQGFNIIKDLDTQLTEMEKVSNESLSNLQAYAKNSFDIASQIGSTGAELQASTADWMRLGKSLQDASELAKTTNILMNVSEFESIDKATESMVSMTQAYQELDSMDIVDKLNLTGNNYSISTDELAQSLQKSSSALKTAKNDFDEAIALTVAGNSVVQDPDSVAAGIRTIALRMTGTDTAKKELEDMGEEADNVLTKSKLNDTLEMLTNIDSRGGISLLDDNGNYRSTAKVLMDLAERWQDIGEQDVKDGQNRQNALLEALAGKNRSNILASILNDPNLIKDVYNDVSTNYQGSAMKENEKYMASIEGHLEKLKNTWQEFWASDNNREFITDILDLANGFIELANSIGGAKVVLTGLFGAFLSFKWKDELTGIFSIIKNIGSEIIKSGNSEIINDYLSGVIGKITNTNIFKGTFNKLSTEFSSLFKKVNDEVSVGFMDVSKNISNGGTSILLALKNIGKFLITNPLGIAISALTIKSLFDNYIKELEEVSRKVEDTLNTHKSKVEELNSFKESMPDLAKEYDSLKEGVSSTGENLSLTNDEFQRYRELTSQIATNFPSLISGYDSTGNAIINLKNSLQDLNEAYDKSLQQEANKTFREMDFDDIEKSFDNQDYKAKENYYQLKKDSKINDFLNGYSYTGLSNKNLNEYGKFVKENFSDNEDLVNISKYLTLDTSRFFSRSDNTFNEMKFQDLAKILAFDQNELDTTIKYFDNLANNTESDMEKEVIDALETYIQNTAYGYQDEISQMKSSMITYVQKKDKYYDLDTTDRNTFNSIIEGLNHEDYEKYNGENVNELFDQYYKYINSEQGSSDIFKLSGWEKLLTGSEGTISENEAKLKENLKRVAEGMGLSIDSVKSIFNIDDSVINEPINNITKAFSKLPDAIPIDKIKKQLKDSLSGEELINLSNRIENIDINEVLSDYNSEFKQYYNDQEKYILDYINSLKNIEPLYTGESKSFSDLESNISNYSSTLAQLTTLGNDNVNINTDLADSLLSMGDGFSEYVEKSEDGTTATIKNIEAVKELIEKKQQEGAIDSRNSRNQAIKDYASTTDELLKLSNQLEATADSEGKLDKSILSNIQSTEIQIGTIKRNIDYYSQLEEKILGATNAFDAYNLAVQQDQSQNKFETSRSMLDTIKSGFETGMMGTASFDSALQGLLSNTKYNEIMNTEDIDSRIQKMKSSYDKLKSYLKKDENGNLAISGIKNFLNDGYSKGLFNSNNFENFDIADNIGINDFVEKMNLSKETIYSMFESIEKYNLDENNSIFDKLLSNSDNITKSNFEVKKYTSELEKQIKLKDDLLVQRSKIDKKKEPETWKNLTEKIHKCNDAIVEYKGKQEESNNTIAESVENYIQYQNEIEKTESKIEIYRKKLNELKSKKEKGEAVSDKEITTLELKTEKAEEKLNNLIKKREKLGQPVTVDLELAKEKIEKEIEDLKSKKIEIEASVTTSRLTSDLPISRVDVANSLLGDKELQDINNKLKQKQANLERINIELGVDATTGDGYDQTIKTIKADKEEIGKDVDFDIKALGISKAIKDINSVKNAQKTLEDKDIVTTHTIIETTIKKDGGGKATATQAVRNIVKSTGTTNLLSTTQQIANGLFNFKPKKKSKKSGDAFGQNNSKSIFNYFGKAYANGRTTNGKLSNVSSHASGNTLVGELGAETIVDPYEGTYKVVGINGAEFVNIPKDAIVFNHQQTKELQKSGKIKSRGAVVSNASGFMQGFAKVSPYGNAYFKGRAPKKQNVNNKNSSKSSKSKSKSNSSSSETKGLIDDIFDWIEIRLQRLSDKTQRYITLAENAISKTVKELGYKYAISTTKTEITNNQAAYKKYASYANALITKAKKNGVTNASAYAKKVRDGSIDLQKISNEKILDFVNSYKEMYDKAKECDSAVLSLTAQLSDLAESLYNLPTEYAEKKIEKFSDEMDVLSAQLEVALDNKHSYKAQNNIIDKQTKLQKSIRDANNAAYANTKKNLSSAKGKINSTKDSALKGLNSKQKKSIVASVNANKEIHISPKYSATLQSAIANYNKALEANRIANNNAKKASAEYTKVLRENTNAKYDNIKSFYDARYSWNDSRISTQDAKLEYRTSMGYSNTSDDYKQILQDKYDYLKYEYEQAKEERSKFDRKTLDEEYANGQLSREDYYSLISHIEELDTKVYETATSMNDLDKEIKKVKITHLDYIIDGISNALEKFKNYISLKEIRGDKATETDYTEQIKYEENQIDILYNKYKELEEEKASYAVESEEYKRVTEEQASIASEALQARQNIDEIRKSVNSIRFKPLEDANASLERQIDDYEHLKDILSKDELIDDNGNFTDSGLANMALIGKQMETSKKLIVNYRTGLEKLTESYKNGNLTLDEYNEQSREYIKSIQDAVSAVDNYRSALIDMYKQQLEAENDTLQKNISLRKESLSAKKSYYDYDKTIKNANKDINSLKNQIAALEGVGNAAAKAEVERLKSQLSEAEENLEDTKYEHLIELKLTGYDEMSKSADEVLKNLLEDITTNADMQEQVISKMLNNVVKNYTTAYDTIKKTINETAINTETSNSLSLVDSILTLSHTLTKGFDKIEKTYGDINTGNIYKEDDSTSDALGAMIGKPSGGNTDRKIVKISVSPKSVSLKVGESKTVKCTVTPSDARLTATSSNAKVATATVTGKEIKITGGSKGSATINISGKNGGATASVEVNVTAATNNVPKPSGKDKPDNAGGNNKQPTSGNGNTGGNTGSKPPTNTSNHAGLVSNLSGNITSSSSSATIKKVQTALKGLGIKGKDGKALTIDGKWGTNTDYAVKYFQRLNKWTGSLTADGIIGTKTKAKFKKAGYYKGGIVDNVMSLNNQEFLNMLRMNKDDGLITAKLGEGVIPKNIMPNFTQQLEKFNSLPADKILNNINNTTPNLEINIDKFMDVHGNVDKNCVNDLRQLQNDITNNITSTLTKEFRKLGYK